MSAIPISLSPRSKTRSPRATKLERTKARDRVLIRAFVFGSISGSVFLASSLMGNVMLEQARSDGKKALRTTLAAQEQQATLQRQVIALTSGRKIANWARIHGYVATEYGVESSSRNSRVAFNR
jgi:hypothetical protein